MATTDRLRNNIIDKLLTISDKDYLSALYKVLSKEPGEGDTVKLTPEQMIMLQMSDRDIKTGRLISQSQLDKQDMQWLKTQ